MSKRFFDCSLADGKREFAPFVPQVVSRARATPDVLTMCTVHQISAPVQMDLVFSVGAENN